MQTQMKQRILGGIVILVVLILFLPILFHKKQPIVTSNQTTNSPTNTQQSPATDSAHSSYGHSIELQLPNKRTTNQSVAKGVVPLHTVTPSVASNAKGSSQQKLIQKVTPQASLIKQPAAPIQKNGNTKLKVKSKSSTEKITAHVQNSQSKITTKSISTVAARVQNSKPKIAAHSISKVPERLKISQKVLKKSTFPNTEKIITKKTLVPASINGIKAWVVQVASFTNDNNARQLVSTLRQHGFNVYVRSVALTNGKNLSRIFVGPEIKRGNIIKIQQKLKSQFKMSGLIRKYTF